MNAIVENVEQTLDGIDLEVIDMPVYNLPDYLPKPNRGDGGC